MSCFAPTSTPFVGSSNMYTSQSAASHFPTATFCWLPPERFLTCCLTLGVEIPRSFTNRFALSSTFRLRIKGPVQNLERHAADKLKLTFSFTRTPSLRRSSGTRAIRFFTAPEGFAIFNSLFFRRTFPPVFLYAPKTVLQSSDFPAPTRPAIPTTSPFFTCMDTSFTLPPAPDRFSVRNSTSPIWQASFGKFSSNLRPSIFSTISFVVVSPVTGVVSIILPFRITV